MSAGGEVIKEFLARLGFEIDEAGAQKFTSWLGMATTRSMAFGAGVMAVAGTVYAGVYRIAEANAELLNTAEALAMDVARLREMNFVAGLTGSSTEALKSSLQGLQAAMAGATIGQGGISAFARLGIRIKDTNGRLRDTGDVLMDVGEKIKKMDRPRAEMFLGQLGIDKSLYRMLTRDVSGLTQAYRDMYAATGMDAKQAAEQSRGFVQEVKLLKEVFKLLGESVAIALIGKAGKDVTAFRKMLLENFKPIMAVLLGLIQLILRVAGFFGALTIRIAQWVGGIIRWFQSLDSATQTLILSVLGFAAAWKFLNLGFMATPIGAIITGLVALVALIDDLMTYMEGGESLIDWGPWAGQIMSVVDELQPLLDALGQLWDMLKGPLADGFKMFGEDAIAILKAVLGAFVDFITTVVKLISGDWTGALESVFNLLRRVADVVNVVAGRVAQFLGGLGSAAMKLATGGDDSAPALGPSPAFAAATAGAGMPGKTEINANTNIYVDGSDNPEAVGQTVLRGQGRANADMVRHTKGAAH